MREGLGLGGDSAYFTHLCTKALVQKHRLTAVLWFHSEATDHDRQQALQILSEAFRLAQEPTTKATEADTPCPLTVPPIGRQPLALKQSNHGTPFGGMKEEGVQAYSKQARPDGPKVREILGDCRRLFEPFYRCALLGWIHGASSPSELIGKDIEAFVANKEKEADEDAAREIVKRIVAFSDVFGKIVAQLKRTGAGAVESLVNGTTIVSIHPPKRVRVKETKPLPPRSESCPLTKESEKELQAKMRYFRGNAPTQMNPLEQDIPWNVLVPHYFPKGKSAKQSGSTSPYVNSNQPLQTSTTTKDLYSITELPKEHRPIPHPRSKPSLRMDKAGAPFARIDAMALNTSTQRTEYQKCPPEMSPPKIYPRNKPQATTTERPPYSYLPSPRINDSDTDVDGEGTTVSKSLSKISHQIEKASQVSGHRTRIREPQRGGTTTDGSPFAKLTHYTELSTSNQFSRHYAPNIHDRK